VRVAILEGRHTGGQALWLTALPVGRTEQPPPDYHVSRGPCPGTSQQPVPCCLLRARCDLCLGSRHLLSSLSEASTQVGEARGAVSSVTLKFRVLPPVTGAWVFPGDLSPGHHDLESEGPNKLRPDPYPTETELKSC
jgi:hypothetical protein